MGSDNDEKTETRSIKEETTDKDDDELGPCTGGRNILLTTTKLLFAAGFLYIFFVSLSLLSDGFIVVGGAGLNHILSEVQDLLNNPFCGLIIGILITVFVQSSSTSTSIFITMAGSQLITVSQGYLTSIFVCFTLQCKVFSW